MHALALERRAENLGVLLRREQEDLIKVMFPDDGVAVSRRGVWNCWPVHFSSGSTTQQGSLLTRRREYAGTCSPSDARTRKF
jgi:hypothetical protein